jgi:dinuclear metal center YbgI/SA1388 family protein
MSVKCQVIIEAVEKIAPRYLAESWDNVGLLLGSPAQDVAKIRVALDVTSELVEAAITDDVDLIVAHHPLIFRAISHVRSDLPQGRLISSLIKNNIAVYAAHTNLDTADGGVSDVLAQCLNLQQVGQLSAGYSEKLVKLVVFVPQSHADQVREAMGRAGAGHTGNYSHCTFQCGGTGTFLPLDGTHPFLGETGKLERVAEVRIETIMPDKLTRKVVKAVLAVHPYEEVAYDVYPLHNTGKSLGLGRIGVLARPVSLAEFAQSAKAALHTPAVILAGSPERTVSKVAVCGGSGAGLIHKAAFAGADVLVTGDVKYHEAQEALAAGLAIVDAGHFATERPVVGFLQRYLNQAALDNKWAVSIDCDTISENVFRVV